MRKDGSLRYSTPTGITKFHEKVGQDDYRILRESAQLGEERTLKCEALKPIFAEELVSAAAFAELCGKCREFTGKPLKGLFGRKIK